MKILVCVKQVPDTTEVKIDPVKGTLIREGVPSILNPDDANALEAALQLKDKDPEGTSVAVLTMGPPQATYMLRECLAMGADEAYLLSDRVSVVQIPAQPLPPSQLVSARSMSWARLTSSSLAVRQSMVIPLRLDRRSARDLVFRLLPMYRITK